MSSERKFKLTTGCKTFGWNTFTDKEMRICDDPECTPCRNMEKAFRDEVSKLLKDLHNPDAPGITGNVFTDRKFTRHKYKPFTSEQLKEAVEYVFKERDNEENKT